MFKAFVCITFITFAHWVFAKRCQEVNEIEHNFHPLRHCQRSNKSVIAYSNVDKVDDCADLARSNRGLAFNFSPRGRGERNFYTAKNNSTAVQDDFYNCEVLDCPEHRSLSSMVNDTRFDYYSLYTQPPRESQHVNIKRLMKFSFPQQTKTQHAFHQLEFLHWLKSDVIIQLLSIFAHQWVETWLTLRLKRETLSYRNF